MEQRTIFFAFLSMSRLSDANAFAEEAYQETERPHAGAPEGPVD